MKKAIVVFVLVLVFLSPFVETLNACTMYLKPLKTEVKVGEVLEVVLERYKTHKVCITSLEETKITVENGEIVDPGVWITGNPDILTFKVVFNKEGENIIKVERSCSKVGTMTVTVLIKVISYPSTTAPQENNTNTENTQTTTPPDSEKSNQEVSPVDDKKEAVTPTEPASPSENIETPENSDQNTQPEKETLLNKILNSLSPKNLTDWLWIVFSIFGFILFLLKKDSLRKPFLFLSILILGFFIGACTCPIGSIFKAVTGFVTLVFLVPVILSFFYGRVFCGWVCPFGAVQEFLKIKSVKNPKIKTSIFFVKLDKILRYLKYFILILFVFLTVLTGRYIWGEVEPFKVLFNFSGTLIATIFLILVLFLSLFIDRPFCRYICPYGAILSITSKFSISKPKIDTNDCISCKRCTNNVCPMMAISNCEEKEKPAINQGECIRCCECKNYCVKDAIEI